jgi:hypothetical protein
LRQRIQDDTARKAAERKARKERPNPLGQAVQDKAVDLTSRGLDKLSTLGKRGGYTAAGLGVAQLATDGLVGKVGRDALNLTRQAGPAYDKLMGRGPKPETSTPVGTPGQSPTVPAGMKIIIGPDGKNKVVPESFDLFDVVKGHLLDEGYADTEEAALVIMANMSEEWRESILSEDPVQDYRDMKRADENRGGARGPELSHNTNPGLKGKPQPGRDLLTQKPTARGREFTNPPS